MQIIHYVFNFFQEALERCLGFRIVLGLRRLGPKKDVFSRLFPKRNSLSRLGPKSFPLKSFADSDISGSKIPMLVWVKKRSVPEASGFDQAKASSRSSVVDASANMNLINGPKVSNNKVLSSNTDLPLFLGLHLLSQSK